VDPGPAMQWDYIIGRARQLMGLPPVPGVDGKSCPRGARLTVDN